MIWATGLDEENMDTFEPLLVVLVRNFSFLSTGENRERVFSCIIISPPLFAWRSFERVILSNLSGAAILAYSHNSHSSSRQGLISILQVSLSSLSLPTSRLKSLRLFSSRLR